MTKLIRIEVPQTDAFYSVTTNLQGTYRIFVRGKYLYFTLNENPKVFLDRDQSNKPSTLNDIDVINQKLTDENFEILIKGDTVEISLSNNAEEVLMQLFLQGPTWDGNLVSKSGRDLLFKMQMVDGYDGWQWLNESGMRYALTMNVKHWADQRFYRKQQNLS